MAFKEDSLPPMTKAEEDAQKVRTLEAQVARLTKEVLEYARAEAVMVAAGVVTKDKIQQAHDIVRDLK